MENAGLNGLSGLGVPAIAALILATMVLGAIAGHALRKRNRRRAARETHESEESIAHEGYLIGAALGTLGLLLAFSFGMVINRYEARRDLAVKEANAIGTAYLRAQFLDEPYRSRLSGLLVEYTDNRIHLGPIGGDGSGSMASNDRFLTELWATLRAARESALAHGLTTGLLATFNEVIDLDAERKVAWQLRLPQEILILLLSYLFITAAVVSYQIDGPRGRRGAVVLFVLLSLSIVFIADINRPMGGREAESQKPLLMLLQSLKDQPPTVFGGMPSPSASSSP